MLVTLLRLGTQDGPKYTQYLPQQDPPHESSARQQMFAEILSKH